jgi:hypothetical protein
MVYIALNVLVLSLKMRCSLEFDRRLRRDDTFKISLYPQRAKAAFGGQRDISHVDLLFLLRTMCPPPQKGAM